ncbi:hypothetical protein [Danxiaibacter flavus]|nr:hypothetical protein QNM32_05040 [Chitinophagaceae bacterium DXS]
MADGISQAERFPVQLSDSFFLIDGKTTGELLKFATALATQINYYNFNHKPDGTWESFFDSDIDVLAALVLQFDLAEWMNRYDSLKEQIMQVSENNEATMLLNNLFKLLYDCSSLMSLLKDKLALAENSHTGLTESAEFSISFTGAHKRLLMYNRQAADIFSHIIKLKGSQEQTEDNDQLIFKGDDIIEQVQSSVLYFDELFAEIRQEFGKLYKAIEFYSSQVRSIGDLYQPHMALFVAFLELYKHLQSNINQLVKKHLDFYFNSLLGINYLKPELQYVLLVLDAAVNTDNFSLPRKELVFGELPGKQTVWYETEEELSVLKTSVVAIRNIFVNEHIHKPTNRTLMSLSEHTIYCGDYPVVTSAAFAANPLAAPSIPVLGEDQILKPAEERTMQEAPVGFMIASSLLYVRDGSRQISIRFTLTSESHKYLQSYVASFADDTEQASQTALYEILNNTFIIDATGDTGWVMFKKISIVAANADEASGSIDVTLELNAEDPPLNVYNPLVHGDNYSTTKPLLRFLLSNRSLHNGYHLFSSLVIRDVSIAVEVHDSSAIQLKNNLGDLNINAPFQPFGPVPVPGSYLDIRNTNILNKYTVDFSVNIEWFDLPKTEGGFEAYYAAYENNIRNNSFKVGASSFREGWFQPAAISQQQFDLFCVDESKSRSWNYLSSTTVIKDVNLKKVCFNNEPLLNNEIKNNNIRSEGVLRLELLEPEDPFGHKAYQVVFPEIVLHNSRRFVRKKPLPNLPYVPVIKSITVSYSQQQREVLRQSDAVNDDLDIELTHIHPFGYEDIYPSAKLHQYTFLPQIDYPCNLLVGLRDVIDDSVITLLFDLEETNFKHSTWQPDIIEWSYLDGNEWVLFNPSDILSDSTENFIKTGILKIRLPDNVIYDHTILPAGLFWLRASCNSLSVVNNKLRGIFPNVVKAVFSTTENNLAQNALYAPKGTIKDFKRKIPQVQKIWDFYGSHGGRATESTPQYYIRVSERLRHKQRALSVLDIAQHVLQAFPDLQMVKCLDADKLQTETVYPVDIKVVVVPRKKKTAERGVMPQVSLSELLEIKKMLQESLVSFATVDVGNPVYETLKINCSVVFNKEVLNASDGYLLQLLNEDIKQMIAPWLYDETNDVKIGSPIYVADIINSIKKLSYIKFVTEFSILQFYEMYDEKVREFVVKLKDTAYEPVEQISPSRPDAVFISADNHLINVEKNFVYEVAAVAGISNLVLGKELLIMEPPEQKQEVKSVVASQDETFDFTVKI